MTQVQSITDRRVPEVRFWACFVVIFALFAQALFPVQALALTMDHTPFAICNDDKAPAFTAKVKTVDTSGTLGLKCVDCVLSSITAIRTPALSLQPVLYTFAYSELKPATTGSPVKARAPPRPYSCGPPSENQA
ncbi:hypothetical protein [Asticcacaulis sp. AC402]|uniref:hypothetical protein n=1 Tax=Asticcacaulis sp. AC402 TaxID=1282361 RepID=UPI0003C3D40C|nr:hypothetical protein [Asticcacaulis sp. AC402]ESQ75439.1 hypothetical protein ABAC402_10085 [Asticcacaulis sp. AC402]